MYYYFINFYLIILKYIINILIVLHIIMNNFIFPDFFFFFYNNIQIQVFIGPYMTVVNQTISTYYEIGYTQNLKLSNLKYKECRRYMYSYQLL